MNKRQQDKRERELNIHNAHDDHVGPFAEISGDRTKGHAQQPRADRAGKADQQRDAAAIHNPGENIPAKLIRPEEVLAGSAGPDRARQLVIQILLRGIIGREDAGCGGHQDDQ